MNRYFNKTSLVKQDLNMFKLWCERGIRHDRDVCDKYSSFVFVFLFFVILLCCVIYSFKCFLQYPMNFTEQHSVNFPDPFTARVDQPVLSLLTNQHVFK